MFALDHSISPLKECLDYIVQGHRYDILEDVGCWPTIYTSAVAIPSVYMWPLIISLVSIPYCGKYILFYWPTSLTGFLALSCISFYRRRADFQRYLAASDAGLNVDRYLRLMALASLEVLVVLPLNLFSIIANMTNSQLLPYTSWEDVHYNFGRVAFVSRVLQEANRKFFIEFIISRWAVPLSGFLFFLFFGLSIEARKDYNRVIAFVLRQFNVEFTPRTPTTERTLYVVPFESSDPLLISYSLDRFLHRKSTGSAKDPFANDNTLTDLPRYTPRRRPDTLASFDSKYDLESIQTTVGRVPPIQIPDAVYSPIYRTSHAARPSLSHSEISDTEISCHTRASSTTYLLRESPITATNSPWDIKPLPPIPGSRPESVATIIPSPLPQETGGVDEESSAPAHRTGELDVPQGDGTESVYYTPAQQRLSLMSTEYQPSIPDMPGAWYTNTKKKGRRPNPFL